MKKRILLVTVVTAVILAFNAQRASADSINTIFTYTYNGPTFGQADPPLTGGHLSMTINLSALLSSATLAFVNPLSWSMSDGVNTFASTDCTTQPCSASFKFASDSKGNVTAWYITASGTAAAAFSVLSFFSPCFCPDQVDSVSDGRLYATVSHNSPTFNTDLHPWVISTSVPEPESLSLLLLSLAVLGYWLRKKGLYVRGCQDKAFPADEA